MLCCSLVLGLCLWCVRTPGRQCSQVHSHANANYGLFKATASEPSLRRCLHHFSLQLQPVACMAELKTEIKKKIEIEKEKEWQALKK